MANQPAAEPKDINEALSPDLSLDNLDEGSPAYKHKKKLILQEKKRRKLSVVEEAWIEVHVDNHHPKGGKVILKKRMKPVKGLIAGSVHSFYLGRYKKGGKEAIQAYKLKGVLVRQPTLSE